MFLDSVCYAAFPEILCSTGKKKNYRKFGDSSRLQLQGSQRFPLLIAPCIHQHMHNNVKTFSTSTEQQSTYSIGKHI